MIIYLLIEFEYLGIDFMRLVRSGSESIDRNTGEIELETSRMLTSLISIRYEYLVYDTHNGSREESEVAGFFVFSQ